MNLRFCVPVKFTTATSTGLGLLPRICPVTVLLAAVGEMFASVHGENPVTPVRETPTPAPLSVEVPPAGVGCCCQPRLGVVMNFQRCRFPAVLPFRSPLL